MFAVPKTLILYFQNLRKGNYYISFSRWIRNADGYKIEYRNKIKNTLNECVLIKNELDKKSVGRKIGLCDVLEMQ